MEHAPLLTICIPTYNRGHRVHSLLRFLLDALPEYLGREVEILVADNGSTDETRALLTPFAQDGVRLHRHEVHFPTAEENMFHSLALCRGRFIWYHGDDDLPSTFAMQSLIQEIANDTADFYCFNSRMLAMDGSNLAPAMLHMHAPVIDTTLRRAVRMLGFTFYLAGMTNVVFRRDLADVTLAFDAYALQPIYSHVAWFIVCFSDKRLRIVNMPLVAYRVSGNVTVDHFNAYSARNAISNYHIWGFGMVRLLHFMVEHHALSPADIWPIFDMRGDRSRYSFVHVLMHVLWSQLEEAVHGKETRHRVSREEFIKARDLFYSVDLALYDLLIVLEDVLRLSEQRPPDAVKKLPALKQRFEKILTAQMQENMFMSLERGMAYGFHLYETLTGFVAMPQGPVTAKEQVLRWLDPLDHPPHCFVALTREALVERLREYVAERQHGAEHHEEAIERALATLHGLHATGQQCFEAYRQASFVSRLFWKLVVVARRATGKAKRLAKRALRR